MNKVSVTSPIAARICTCWQAERLVSRSAPFLAYFPCLIQKIPHLDVWVGPGAGWWLVQECNVSLSASPHADKFPTHRYGCPGWLEQPLSVMTALCMKTNASAAMRDLVSARTIEGGLLENQLMRLWSGSPWKGWSTGCSGKSLKKNTINITELLEESSGIHTNTSTGVVKSLD